jgi:ribosomal protein S18 acetylase RimI-like enzyme
VTFRELRSNDEIRNAFPLMATLRDRVRAETFLDEVRAQQLQGYELIGGFAGDRLVVLAGIRRSHTLSRGSHLFVDDLVTDESVRGQGHGRAMLDWLGARAAAEGIPKVYLDSRATARGFYERVGFTFMTAIPCWKDTAVDSRESAVASHSRQS